MALLFLLFLCLLLFLLVHLFFSFFDLLSLSESESLSEEWLFFFFSFFAFFFFFLSIFSSFFSRAFFSSLLMFLSTSALSTPGPGPVLVRSTSTICCMTPPVSPPRPLFMSQADQRMARPSARISWISRSWSMFWMGASASTALPYSGHLLSVFMCPNFPHLMHFASHTWMPKGCSTTLSPAVR